MSQRERGKRNQVFWSKASAENFPVAGGGETKKRQKNSKKYRKITIFSLFQGRGATEKMTEKYQKKAEK